MMRPVARSMRNIIAAACAAAICSLAGPAAADPDCADSRCAQIHQIPPPKVRRHNNRKQICGCEAPPGWGWYLRHKFYHDCSQPLVVSDELGSNVSVHENW